MFDIGWSEILIIAIVAIVVVGPKDLPPMLRAAGRMVSKLRKTAGEFQSQFNEALREAELDGVKDSLNELRGLNPMNEIRKQLDPIQAALAKPEPVAKPAPDPVPPPMDQLAQPMTDADLVPAADPLPVDQAAQAEKKPARKRKPKADVAEGETPPAPKRVAKPKAAEAVAEAEVVAAVKKPRAPRAKPVAKAAPTTSSPAAEPLQLDLASSLSPPAAPLAPMVPAAPANEIAAAPTPAPPTEERS
ncbi:Sec-independent protein translocase protein TatB [Mesorhizobium sp. BR1-1-16]|uniref:Sec-independent protein translocase protein TatB n=1 Tax=Mesorhizobium sp. BR1-1-16 TaxID=2876653 RepID=UPI001CCF422B|nr:Sec-independent protein translocase protein TatB [Mesorhizobium sp. BR1-1-16]MBZ9935454.1 Sec-independent protein translocase protein TatB [Mesorhizobium sp. BR1-1-16]